MDQKFIGFDPLNPPQRSRHGLRDRVEGFLEGRAFWLSAFPDDLKDAARVSCEQASRWVENFCGW